MQPETAASAASEVAAVATKHLKYAAQEVLKRLAGSWRANKRKLGLRGGSKARKADKGSPPPGNSSPSSSSFISQQQSSSFPSIERFFSTHLHQAGATGLLSPPTFNSSPFPPVVLTTTPAVAAVIAAVAVLSFGLLFFFTSGRRKLESARHRQQSSSSIRRRMKSDATTKTCGDVSVSSTFDVSSGEGAAEVKNAARDYDVEQAEDELFRPTVPTLPLEGGSAEQMIPLFRNAFGVPPEHVVKAPGRVNLIGEHIDYSFFDVAPMAIELAVHIAVGMGNGPDITVSNAEAKYPTQHVTADPKAEVGRGLDHRWSGYFQCGYIGVFELAQEEGLLSPELIERGIPGLNVMVKGNIPAAGGLSSSAAMVVASALATARVLGLNLSQKQLAELAIRGERHIGVLSGGMDQTASVMGRSGAALHISFRPSLSAKCVPLPVGYSFVICHSGVKAEKAVSALYHYNKRVVECSLAAALLAKTLGRADALTGTYSLRDVALLLSSKGSSQPQGDGDDSESRIITSELLDRAARWSRLTLAHTALGGEKEGSRGGVYTLASLRHALGLDPAELFASQPAALAALHANSEFMLADRAVHVFKEASRVLKFVAVCNTAAPSEASWEARAEALGALMNESHASCAELYDCSCPELERLVTIARDAGAKGSRLSGAGWGGCTISLVKDAAVDLFLKRIRQEFFGGEIRYEGDLFVSKPSHGACIYRLGGALHAS